MSTVCSSMHPVHQEAMSRNGMGLSKPYEALVTEQEKLYLINDMQLSEPSEENIFSHSKTLRVNGANGTHDYIKNIDETKLRIDSLPGDMLQEVLWRLDAEDLLNAVLVCKDWRNHIAERGERWFACLQDIHYTVLVRCQIQCLQGLHCSAAFNSLASVYDILLVW